MKIKQTKLITANSLKTLDIKVFFFKPPLYCNNTLFNPLEPEQFPSVLLEVSTTDSFNFSSLFKVTALPAGWAVNRDACGDDGELVGVKQTFTIWALK